MNMGRLVGLVAIEIEAIRTRSKDGRHAPILPDCGLPETGIN
jgi:hypothetical protein